MRSTAYGANKSGSITAYAVDAASGALKKLNTVDSGGPIPCYVVTDPSGKFLLVANYTGGSYSVTRIKAGRQPGRDHRCGEAGWTDGRLSGGRPPVGMAGSKEPHGSRGHMILPDPSGQYVLGADAGRDQIFVWKLDANTGKLNQVSVTKSVPGAGPRHFAFSPDGKTLFQLQEQNSRIQVYSFAGGKLTAKGGSVSTLPDGFSGRQHHLGAVDRQGGQASLCRQPQS
jgi:6-phosphogluconolactonase (cycloisomerase 2 family)